MTTKPNVAVVFGGQSPEHGISCVSAGNVLTEINRERYDVIPVGIDTQGTWRLVADTASLSITAEGQLPQVPNDGVALRASCDRTRPGFFTETGEYLSVDVIFPVLHGVGGEDGTIQGLAHMMGIPIVGSGVAASAVCMDKIRTKQTLESAGIPSGSFVPVLQWPEDRSWIDEQAAALTWPVFVKPARAGSSIGIRKVSDPDELDAAIDHAHQFDDRVIIESGITGAREIECGVLVIDGRAQASVCAEVVVAAQHEFYDFTAKYIDGSTQTTVPADLDQETSDAIRQMALRVFSTLGCEGMARVDVFVTPDGQILVNEPNTIPGFTLSSMFPVMWQSTGVSYPELIDILITDALRRAEVNSPIPIPVAAQS